MKEFIKGIGKKVGIFKISQYKKIDKYTGRNKKLFGRFLFWAVDQLSDNKIRYGWEQQNTDEKSAGFVIKEEADKEQISISHALSFVDHRIEEQYHRKEPPKEESGKDHGFSFVVRKNMSDIFRTEKVVKPL